MIHTYRCTGPGCGAEVVLDDEQRTLHVVYPRGMGPLSEEYRRHDCPIAKGLWPPEIDAHPLATKVD